MPLDYIGRGIEDFVNKPEEKKCYQEVFDKKIPCEESECRHYLASTDDLNCTIIAAKSGPKTLQEIGDYYGISRMRVCQIEKAILRKLRSSSKELDLFDSLSSE